MNHHASPALPGQPASPETSEPPQPMRELDIDTLRQQARDHALAAAGDPEGVASVEEIWHEYVPDPARRLEPGASPMRAVSLAGLAPTLFITAGRDIPRAETREYARRLAADGVPVRRGNYPAASHGFYHLLAATPCARDAVGRPAAALRGAFSEHQVSGPAPQRRRTEPQGMRQPRISS